VVKQNRDKLIIADFGARNVERLKIFLEIAEKHGRKLAITTKDAYLLHLFKDDGIDFIDFDSVVIIESKREQKRKWVNGIFDLYSNKLVTVEQMGNTPSEYIVCYSFWDMPNLLDTELDSGAYIYSTSEAFTEEQEIDTRRLLNWLKYFHLKP